jgi:hypothetical protein
MVGVQRLGALAVKWIAILCFIRGHDWRPSTTLRGAETCARCHRRRVLIPAG